MKRRKKIIWLKNEKDTAFRKCGGGTTQAPKNDTKLIYFVINTDIFIFKLNQ